MILFRVIPRASGPDARRWPAGNAFRAAAVMLLACGPAAGGAEPDGSPRGVPAVTPAPDTRPAAVDPRHERFAALMKGVRLVGSFTRDDDEAATPRREEYEISGATKIGSGDGWLVMARIRYGTVDVTVPVPVEVKWAGETPVITLDDVTLPGLGTFSSRVVLDRGRYAGTWTHDEVGGHMFGRIVTTGRPAESRPPAGDGPGASAGPSAAPAALRPMP